MSRSNAALDVALLCGLAICCLGMAPLPSLAFDATRSGRGVVAAPQARP